MKKPALVRSTLRPLDSDHLAHAAGGRERPRGPTIRHIPDGNSGKAE